ncbi:putative ATPase implicated in cell cycle control [Methanothermus fervidus DSM 2088]|uniref:Putative ATPase implicated in cell cycle control n=1 Tax=Methanothermus fervidus (strain ATCC 43054 / DSM 2088 / JCM 10308 / V24 S) TaxID=523846 RepID=E3GY52_METFV|nr:hypothetical protein [Methanothermus fervidus]ADP77234.1 putative ATPase implicated in cell cycle control [Methanothermus fervidus DSM 2088]
MKKEKLLKFLSRIGVDTRFITIIDSCIYINNLRFSRFSRKREKILKKYFPEIKVIRSKIFQRISTRSKNILRDELKPKDRVLIMKTDKIRYTAAYAVLEPYTRKYGIKIVEKNPDCIVNPLTLDDIVINVFKKLLSGKKLKMEVKKDNKRVIYPLSKVPYSWICKWLKKECKIEYQDKMVNKFMDFFNTVVPDYKEKIASSILELSKVIKN